MSTHNFQPHPRSTTKSHELPDDRPITKRGPARRTGATVVLATALVGSLGLATTASAKRGDRDRQNDSEGVNALVQANDDDGRRGNRNGNRNGGLGGFRFDCDVSHFSLDDPIVFPREVGAAHDHMFWGNTSTDAFSTEQSLLDNAASTCEGRRDGNQAAYWTPVLFDASGDLVEPTDIDVRYRGRGNVNPIPNGLQMLATPDVVGADANDFEIEDDDGAMEIEVRYPNCLAIDAVGSPVLTSDDNISHTAYADDGDCPESHPHRIPSLRIDLEFDLDIDTEWRLSSDMDGMEQGASLHADYFAAWTDDPPGS